MRSFLLLIILFTLTSCLGPKKETSFIVLIGGAQNIELNESRDFARFFNSIKKTSHGHKIIDLTQEKSLTKDFLLTKLKGDVSQVLFVIHSHGQMRGKGELTHSVELKQSRFSLDMLSPVISKLQKRNIRVGIIDHSCYSGNTIELGARHNICAIATASKNRLSYVLDTVFGNFDYKDLGEYYFKQREAFFTPSLPRGVGDVYDQSIYEAIDQHIFINVDEVINYMNTRARLNGFDEGIAIMKKELGRFLNDSSVLKDYEKLIKEISRDYLELLPLMKEKRRVGEYDFASAVFRVSDINVYKQLQSIKTSNGELSGDVARRFIKRFDDMNLQSKMDILAQKIITAERAYYVKLNHNGIGKSHPCSQIKLNLFNVD